MFCHGASLAILSRMKFPDSGRFSLALLVSLCLHGGALSVFALHPGGRGVMPPSVMQLTLVSTRPTPVNEAPPELAEVLPVSPPPAEMRTVSRPPRLQEKSVRLPPRQARTATTAPSVQAAPAVRPSEAIKSAPVGKDALIKLPGLSGVVARAEIEFELFSGPDNQPAGRARHQFHSDQQAYYGIRVEHLDSGAGAEAVPDWSIEVAGGFWLHGLGPISYKLSGGMSERLIALGELPSSPLAAREGQMLDSMLDRQSLIYQVMAKPPEPGGGSLWLSDGERKRLFDYRISVFDAQPITALDGVRAIKLDLLPREGTDSIELWLVPDMHYLPVRVRYTDSRGDVSEQRAVKLDFSLQ